VKGWDGGFGGWGFTGRGLQQGLPKYYTTRLVAYLQSTFSVSTAAASQQAAATKMQTNVH